MKASDKNTFENNLKISDNELSNLKEPQLNEEKISSEVESFGKSSFPSVDEEADIDLCSYLADYNLAPCKTQPTLNNKTKKNKNSNNFKSLGLDSLVLNAILKLGYKNPTPIQRKSIPLVLNGYDIVCNARTGSGKTLAFAAPIINKLKTHSMKVGIRSLIISPSRELTLQTCKVFKKVAVKSGLRIGCIVGGDTMESQFSMLINNPDIVVATPGRFLHIITECRLSLMSVETIVFDECDRLFELGFLTELKEILSKLPKINRQTLLFSATLPKQILEFSMIGLKDPVLVRLDTENKLSEDLQEAALLYLLKTIIFKDINSMRKTVAKEERTQVMIFVLSKYMAEYLHGLLQKAGYDTGLLYGSMDQLMRKKQMYDFRHKKTEIFVVTDLAARGIDIPVMKYAINYDFVDEQKVFVHRVGRVARNGMIGFAYSFISSLSDLAHLYELEPFLGKKVNVIKKELKIDNTNKETKEENIDYVDQMVIGSMPTTLEEFRNESEFVVRYLEDSEVAKLKQQALNALKMIKKTRTNYKASENAYTKAKILINNKDLIETIHPLFGILLL